jgi:hypothetical protein
MQAPIAHITCSIDALKYGLNIHPKFTTVSSININHAPRFNKNNCSSSGDFLLPDKYAEIPAKKINMGAQK